MSRTLFVLAAAVTSLQAHAAPRIVLGGFCPGITTIEIRGITPGRSVSVMASAEDGASLIPAGPRCAGVETGLGGSIMWKHIPDIDGDGTVIFEPTVMGPMCDIRMQVMDNTTCEVSDVVILGDRPDVVPMMVVSEGRNGGYGTEFGIIDPDAGVYEMLGESDTPMTGLSFGMDGELFGVSACGFGCSPEFFTVDTTTGEQTFLATSSEAGSHSGFSHGPDGELYGFTESSDDFLWIDPFTGDTEKFDTSIGSYDFCLATDADGFIYGISGTNLYTIDPADPGAYVDLGTVSGLTSASGTGCTFHEGFMYHAAGGTGTLHQIDVAAMSAVDMGISIPDGADALASNAP
jgi:hypothetical protein